MGREWHWSGRYSNRSGAGGEKDSTSSSGCMSAVFQFFDFHQFQFALHHQQPSFETTSILPDEPFSPKGVEAPRNSLQSEELPFSLSTRERQEEDLNIPMSIQIRTCRNTGSKAGTPNEFSSEISSSPGTKTPNLVARLMGLDLLPETNSPSSSSSSTHGTSTSNLLSKTPSRLLRPQQLLQSRLRKSLDKDIAGTRSLPETPRVSSARKSDVDHRFSLQINKENLRANEDLEFSRFSYLRRKELRVQDENNKSPSQHARQIVKQMKEKFSRKVGLDITNTVMNRDQLGRTEVVSQFKSRKSSKAFTKSVEESSPGKHSSPSCSPRLRFYETKIKPSATAPSTNDKASHYSKPSSPLLSSPLNILPQPTRVSVKQKSQPLPIRQQPVQKSVQKCKKMASERFGERLKKPPQTSDIIRNKKEEPFVHPSTSTRANTVEYKKCKKTPLSNGLLNIAVPNLLPVKKDPSPPAPNVPQIESQVFDAEESRCSSQLPSSASQRYKQEAMGTLMVRESDDDRSNGVSTIGASGAEYEYVSNILSRTGIDKETAVSFNNWFSPSHPLDPSIFDQLTASTTSSTESMTGHLGYKLCNQKLLFHVVDELLVEILKPYISMKPWASSKGHGHPHMQGSQLIDTLCRKIRSFPYADCRVLEDIDALIDKDLMHLRVQSSMAFEEEGEDIVTDIEKDIWDSLVHEIVCKFCREWAR